MFRKSLLASALALALLPHAGWALGLGGIHTESALNEPFVGQIDLLDVPLDQLDTVKVLLASDAEFSKVAADRPYFLTKLKFQPQVSPQGRAIIRVTSSDPVREPFLDFLVDVNWPKGRLVKEYTVLLDPPTTAPRPPPRVTQPVVQRSPQQAVQRSASTPPIALSKPPASVDTSAFPLRHGPIAPGAGLWQIARRMAPAAGATVAQTAMALYRNNQGAFIHGDINKLKVNETLEIPTAAELFALDAGSAEQEFRAALRGERVDAAPLTDTRTAQTQEDRLQIAGAAKPTPATEVPEQAPSQSAGQTPSQEVTGEEATTGPSSQMPSEQAPGQLANTNVTGESGLELGAIREDLLLVQEAGESTRQETEELRTRIRELESQLTDIQKLLKLSNQRFAQLQQSGAGLSGSAAAKSAETPPAAKAAEPRAQATQDQEKQAGPEQKQTKSATAETAQPPAKIASQAKNPPVSVEEQSPPENAGSFWGSFAQPPWIWAILLLPLLALLAWMARRRRKSLQDFPSPGELAFEAPTSAGAEAGAVTAAPLPEQEVNSTPATAASSTFSEDLNDLEDETEEADAISEADVYLAYGRYREAAALLEEHAEKSPDRLDIKYKLAEAYYGAGQAEPMEALMQQMQQAGSDREDSDRWQRLVNLLGKLKGTGAVTAFAATSLGASVAPDDAEPRRRQETAAVPPELSSPEQAPKPDPAAPLDAFAAEFAQGSTATGKVSTRLELRDEPTQDLELDLDDLDITAGEPEALAREQTREIAADTSDFDFQLDDFETLQDLDLAFSESDSHRESTRKGTQDEDLLDSDIESLDLSPIGQDTLEGDASTPEWEIDSGMWDEVATKIDLARAYMEMEDLDAARVILEEVVQEGNESQQAEARELMTQLGA